MLKPSPSNPVRDSEGIQSLISTRASVIERQKGCGAFIPAEFVNNAANINYFQGHVIEELCEFALAPQSKKASEAADVIIFLQLYLAVELPEYKLDIKLQNRRAYTPLPELIFKLRGLANRRKSWKTYTVPKINEYRIVGALIVQYLLWYVPADEIMEAYNLKVKSNETRDDWDRF